MKGARMESVATLEKGPTPAQAASAQKPVRKKRVSGTASASASVKAPAKARATAKEKPAERSAQKPAGGAKKLLGARGEEAASAYLERQGIQIIERNWRCSAGEADIIARESDALVFIEVKTRTTHAAGLPEEAITKAKRARYEKIAIEYLDNHDLPSSRVRFDVISINVSGKGRAFLRHHRDAFCAGE
jgi:putative endonuclease